MNNQLPGTDMQPPVPNALGTVPMQPASIPSIIQNQNNPPVTNTSTIYPRTASPDMTPGIGSSTNIHTTNGVAIVNNGMATLQNSEPMPMDTTVNVPPSTTNFPMESQASGEGQERVKELRVEDALLYLDQVKQQFGSQPAIYNQFLDVMKNFKSQEIDTPGVINRVSTLFKGYPKLILGFNTFLPPGFKIREDSTYEYPDPPGSSSSHYGGVNRTTTNVAAITGMPRRNITASGSSAAFSSEPINANLQVSKAVQGSGSANTTSIVGTPANTAAIPSTSNSTRQNNATQPVEFDHAISYVTTIKKRFSDEPETYKSFLEILHTYQREQRSIKQVLDQVSYLFRDHPDLLREFTYFLPDAAQEQAKEKLNRAADKAQERKRAAKRKADLQKQGTGSSYRKKGDFYYDRRDGKDRMQKLYKDKKIKKKQYDEKERRDRFAVEETSILPSEWMFFEKAKKVLPSRDAWREFMKCLDLYSQEIIGRDELFTLVSGLFGRHADIVRDFKQLVNEHGLNEVASSNNVWFSMPLAEIDFSRCRRCTPSYRALPSSYPIPPCSVRSDLEKAVCNDAWVSVPTGSEDFSFKNMRKNQYEEALFKSEDERFEIDMVIDANASTIRILEPLAQEIQVLREKEDTEVQWQYRLDRRTLGTIHLNAISRVYGESGNEILEMLRKHPAGAIPVILERLKQKDGEWRRARQELNKQWKEVNEKNFHKSLDHCSFYFKQHDKKQISTKGLVTEAKEAAEKQPPLLPLIEGDDNSVNHDEKPWRCHFTFEFEDPSIHKIIYKLLFYAVEKNATNSEKERIQKLWSTYLLPLFNLPEDWLRDPPKTTDDTSNPLNPGTDVQTSFDEGTVDEFCEESKSYVVHLPYGQAYIQANTIQHEKKDLFPPNICVSDDKKYTTQDKVNHLASEYVKLLYEGQAMYLFLRLYQMLWHRLCEAQKLCEKAKRNRKKITFNPAARALAHHRHLDQEDVSKEKVGDFAAYLTTLYALVDGSIDNARYEDSCRNLMGSSSFLLFTMDKLVSQVVKHLQSLSSDDPNEFQHIFEEENNKARTIPSEYLSRVKPLFEDEDAYRIQFYTGVLRQTPLTPPSPEAASENGPAQIWAPSPRVREARPSPWLVKPTLLIEYLGCLNDEVEDDEEASGSPERIPLASPTPENQDTPEEEKEAEGKKRRREATDLESSQRARSRPKVRSRSSSAEYKQDADVDEENNHSKMEVDEGADE